MQVDEVTSEIGRSIKYNGRKLWNNVPDDINSMQSSQSFKHKMKNYFLHYLVLTHYSEVHKFNFVLFVIDILFLLLLHLHLFDFVTAYIIRLQHLP